MKKIVVVAHDSMKPVLVDFLEDKKDWFWGRKLVATGLTADFVENINVEHLSAGKHGGYR